jgi:hypothetical protein
VLCHLSHAPDHFCFRYFSNSVSYSCLGWPGHNPSIYAFHIAEMTGVSQTFCRSWPQTSILQLSVTWVVFFNSRPNGLRQLQWSVFSFLKPRLFPASSLMPMMFCLPLPYLIFQDLPYLGLPQRGLPFLQCCALSNGLLVILITMCSNLFMWFLFHICLPSPL